MTSAHGAGLATLLNMIECEPETIMHASTWEAELGGAVVASLRRCGVLVDRGVAHWYPCESPLEGDCLRRIEPHPESSRHPYRAVCGYRRKKCGPIALTNSEVGLLGLSRETLIHRLRQALGVSGPVEQADAGFPETRLIGRLANREVYLALAPGIPGFEAWLALRRRAYVLVPVGKWLSSTTKDRFAAGNPTELVILDDTLDLVDGAFVVKRPIASEYPPRDSGVRAIASAESVVCVVHDNDGRRELTAGQYRDLLVNVDEYDLFLDMTTVATGGGYRGRKRDLDGVVTEVVLTRNEAAVVVELAAAGRALRPGEFKSVTASHVDKLVERARRKIDVPLGRYQWRAIHTMKGSVPEAKEYRFRPDMTMSWKVIIAW